MSSYILKNKNKKEKIVKEPSKYYIFYPKKKIKSFIIYDENIVNIEISKKFLKEYKTIIDSDNEDGIITLSHIQKLKSTLEYVYKKYLKSSLYEKFLNDLIEYEKYLNSKLLYNEYVNKDAMVR